MKPPKIFPLSWILVALAAAAKIARAGAIATTAPRQRKALPAQLSKKRRKVRGDQRSEWSNAMWSMSKIDADPRAEGQF
jgi:hypothetical protein